MVLTLYTGADCHLCEQAEAIVAPLAAARGLTLIKVDISSEPTLFERYRTTIPVLSVNTEEKGWPFTAGQVARLLERAG